MHDLAVPVFIFSVGLWLWFLRHVYKKFGWEALGLKSALVIDGGFIFAVALHQLPGTEIPGDLQNLDDVSLYFAFPFLVVWLYLVVADRPMRWLAKPPVNWVIYGLAALFYISVYVAEKGWR